MPLRDVVPSLHIQEDESVTTQIWGKGFSGWMDSIFLEGPLFCVGAILVRSVAGRIWTGRYDRPSLFPPPSNLFGIYGVLSQGRSDFLPGELRLRIPL